MFGFIKELLGLGRTIIGGNTQAEKDALAAQTASRRNQAEINQAEIGGAPASRLRLWRSALGWALSLCFIWEAMIRPAICTYWPDALLPPSFIKEITSLLLGMLGLGF